MNGGCGGPTPEEEEETSSIPLPTPQSQTCVRCSRPATRLLHVTSYCTDCFVEAFEQKVRKGFEPAAKKKLGDGLDERRSTGKRKALPKEANDVDARPSVMIAFSGGASSRTMMTLFKSFYVDRVPTKRSEKYTPQSPFKAVEVVWVDESGVPGLKSTFSACEIVDLVSPTGFFLHSIPLSSLLSPPSSLSSLFSCLPPTSSTSLHHSLLHSLLRLTAAERGHSILLSGETATRIAVRTLSGVAEGRGWGLGEEVAGEWGRETNIPDEDLRIVRPLGGVGLTELNEWGKLKGWEPEVKFPVSEQATLKERGMEQLCEDFVLNLDAAFPSTVTTIMRTAGKLGLRTNDPTFGYAMSCPICGLPAQPEANEWRTSITVSTFDSPSTPPSPKTSDSVTCPLPQLLCYGCLLIYEPLAAHNVALPPYVELAAKRRIDEEKRESQLRRSDLRSVVQEFLIDEEE